ncbi:MAG: hypothetical protein ABEI52_11765 [Halobacteriaceae archaeon]
MVERDIIRSRTTGLFDAFWLVLGWLQQLLGQAKQAGLLFVEWLGVVVRGPAKRIGFSIVTTVVAIGITPATAWWTATTTGYPPIETLVTETWYGTDPHMSVFVLTGALVGLGALSAAINSGIIPTHLLVSAPLFGVAVTRYGTQSSYPTGEVAVVSLPEAIEFATAVGVLGSVPITLVGFVLGELLYRGITRVDIPVQNLLESIVQ